MCKKGTVADSDYQRVYTNVFTLETTCATDTAEPYLSDIGGYSTELFTIATTTGCRLPI
jgi:hypothetical protein